MPLPPFSLHFDSDPTQQFWDRVQVSVHDAFKTSASGFVYPAVELQHLGGKRFLVVHRNPDADADAVAMDVDDGAWSSSGSKRTAAELDSAGSSPSAAAAAASSSPSKPRDHSRRSSTGSRFGPSSGRTKNRFFCFCVQFRPERRERISWPNVFGRRG